MDEVIPKMGISKRPSSSLLPSTRSNVSDVSKKEFPITFSKIGRFAYEITLYAQTASARTKWLENIGAQQELLRAKGHFYNQKEICADYFPATNRVNCVAPFGELPYSPTDGSSPFTDIFEFSPILATRESIRSD